MKRMRRCKQKLPSGSDPSKRFVMPTFFFQAEDGIRHADVTGVQTCALPISGLPRSAVVTAARFACVLAPEERVRAEIAEARRWRRDNQPVNQPNCGSVFANPLPLAAGQVVERLGMKGERRGGARISEVHANFIVAADGARSADVLALIRRAMRRARDELGVELRTEVQLVGDFTGEAGR